MSKAKNSLRLQPSLKAAAGRLALREGASLYQFINAAVAEKLAASETEEYFKDRAKTVNRENFKECLDGADNERAGRCSVPLNDAMILAAALHSGFDTPWSEDMQDGMVIENRLRIRNPFSHIPPG